MPTILEQKVTGIEARRSYGRLVRRYGEPAPGPFGLQLPPDPARARGRCRTTRSTRAASNAGGPTRSGARARGPAGSTRLAGVRARATRRACSPRFPGVGPWTAAEVCAIALGDRDAVSVGDYHLPHVVAWALAGEPRADDARMLELLEPFRGQRARVDPAPGAVGELPAPPRAPRTAPRSSLPF